MDDTAQYWTFLYLRAAGTLHNKTIDSARAGMESCSDLLSQAQLPHRAIQRRLVAASEPGAAAALRCYISHQIVYTCDDLVAGFGSHGFSRADLLPLVLDDRSLLGERRDRPPSAYKAFATTVLETFDPQQSSLSTWTTRLVRQHKELNDLLLEYGVYLVSDWAILNDTKESQLQSALGDFHHVSAVELDQASALLEGYHAIYRYERLQKRQTGRCPAPSADQLQRIAIYLDEEYSIALADYQVMQRLQTLAQQLRALRIYSRSKVLPAASLDTPNHSLTLDNIPSEDRDLDGEEGRYARFLAESQQEFLASLDEALKIVIEQRVALLKRRKARGAAPNEMPRPQQFLKGLQLFHCLGQTMTEIAPQIDAAARTR